MTYRATKSRILFGWCFMSAAVALLLFLTPRLAIALTPLAAIIGGAFLGPRQSKPLSEMVEDDPSYWRRVAFIYMVVALAVLYTAFFHRTVLFFLIGAPVGRLVLFLALFGPFMPSIYAHERERYRNAPEY